MKITMRYPLWTFWRRQARGQEVPSAATARVAVRQMIGRYAASATDERSPRRSGRPEFADQCVGSDDADAGVGLGVGDADRCGTRQGGLMRSSWRRNSLGALTMSPRNWSVQGMLRGVLAARGLAGGGLPRVILAGGGEQLPPVDPVPHTPFTPTGVPRACRRWRAPPSPSV